MAKLTLRAEALQTLISTADLEKFAYLTPVANPIQNTKILSTPSF